MDRTLADTDRSKRESTQLADLKSCNICGKLVTFLVVCGGCTGGSPPSMDHANFFFQNYLWSLLARFIFSGV